MGREQGSGRTGGGQLCRLGQAGGRRLDQSPGQVPLALSPSGVREAGLCRSPLLGVGSPTCPAPGGSTVSSRRQLYAQAHPGPYIMQYLPGDDWQPPSLLSSPASPHPHPPRPTMTSQTCIKARVTYRAVRRSVLRQNYRREEKDFYQINEKSIWPQKSISRHNVPVTGWAARSDGRR